MASSRVYVFQFLPFLKNDGFQYTIMQFGPHPRNSFKSGLKRYLKAIYIYSRLIYKILALNISVIFMSSKYDTIFCQKVVLLPFTSGFLIRRNKHLVYCFDDAVYLRQNFWPIGIFRRAQFDAFLNKSPEIVVGTPYYFEQFSAIRNRIKFIPNAVNTAAFLNKVVSIEKTTIGWIGSPNTTKYLMNVFKVFKQLSEKYKDRVQFVIIGSDKSKLKDFTFCEFYDWELEGESELISKLDIGIMPLDDTEWERGKCGYKLIQYFAAGIPAVASPVGINRNLVENSEAGFLCSDDESWFKNLDTLINDRELREVMGNKGRKYAVDNHDVRSIYDKQYKHLFLK